MSEIKGFSISKKHIECAPGSGKDVLKRAEIESLLEFAECDMCASRAARKLFYTEKAIRYRLCRVKEKTGLDPYRFYDLVKLVQMYGEQEV